MAWCHFTFGASSQKRTNEVCFIPNKGLDGGDGWPVVEDCSTDLMGGK
jgi:hypothetical protein